MEKNYQPELIEAQAQDFWQQNNAFVAKEDTAKQKFYCLSMLPYPSGDLHMGHVRNYVIGDVIARYQTLLGKAVLQPMGWDAFGLPAENAALKNKVAPSEWTRKNISDMRAQLQQLGLGIDWQREIATCDPRYYRWEQWLFTRMVKQGLAYRKNMVVNWDPVDNTVLANEQVIDGRGWRSGALVERREITQWFLKITDYAEELLKDLAQLDQWPEQVRTMQENWIGRSQGLDIHFSVSGSESLTVYTTRPDTLWGATYLAIAPEHPLALAAAEKDPAIAAFLEKCRHIKVSEMELATMEKEGVDSGFEAINPLNQQKVPIWIANYVVMDYGSGAVMAVPAHDQRDFEFAHKYKLPIKQVIQPIDDNSNNWDFKVKAFTDAGRLIHSGEFSGMSSAEAVEAISTFLHHHGHGEKRINYRLRDWGISRQRYWGTPIPIIYCDHCGIVTVPEEDLPVLLPENITLTEPASPLKSMPEFYQTTCPQCQSPAKRETDTFDTFVESSWYYARYACPDQNEAMLDDRVNYWLGVDQYIGGIEHAVLHLLYARFFYKVLRDQGLVKGNEPFLRLLTQGMVLKDGAKMSKSKGNTVSPRDLIAQYGADTVRLFIIFASPPEQSLEWSDSGVEGAYRFLKRLWVWAEQLQTLGNLPATAESYTEQQKNSRREIHEILRQASNDMERQQLNTVVSAAMKLLNVLYKLPLDSLADRSIAQEGSKILLILLAPITPHIAHHLWQELGYVDNILNASWPVVDNQALECAQVNMVVQINGKLRGSITVAVDADQELIQQTALQDEQIMRHLDGKIPKKVIVVPKKLVSIVI